METATVAALLAATVYTLVNLAKYVTNGSWNGAVTIVSAWAAGFVACLALKLSDLGSMTLDFIGREDLTFEDANNWTLVFVGFAVASAAGAFNDWRESRDNNGSSSKPALTHLK